MTGAPRVVVVLDPAPGSQPADRLAAAGGRSLAATVAERATAERGRAEGTCHGAADLAGLLSRDFAGPGGSADGPLCLLDGAALALPTTYGDLVADPRAEPAVLRTSDGTVVGVRLDGPLAPGAAAAGPVEETVTAAVAGAAPGRSLAELGHAVVLLLAAAGVAVRDVRPGPFPLRVVGDEAALAEALAAESAVDEAALRLRRSSRADDGFLSTFLVRPLSRRLTRRAVARGVRPDVVTLCSGLLGLVAAVAYALAGNGSARAWLVTGSVLLLVSLVVDCVDGEVARYTRTFSPLGGWLDVGSDRLKEYAVYAGLAAGARPSAWPLAAAAFAVLVVRHFIDFGYAATVSGSPTGPGGGRAGAVAAWSERTSGTPALLWAKRAVIMPVGERTILLAVLAPIVGARWTLGLLLAAGCLSALYTLGGRLGRTTGLAWLAPALARAVEAGGLAALVGWHRPGALPAAYLLLAAVALHQYDVVYRQRLTGVAAADADPGWLGRVPWPVRVVIVVALTLVLPVGALTAVLAGAGVVLLAAAGVDSLRWWRAFVRSAP